MSSTTDDFTDYPEPMKWSLHRREGEPHVSSTRALELAANRDRSERKKITKSSKGIQILDILNRLGETYFNPDDISLKSYDRMMQDAHVRGSYEAIYTAVVSKGWVLNGGEQEHRDFIQQCLDNTNFDEALRGIITAIKYGWSTTKMVFDTNSDNQLFVSRFIPLNPFITDFDVKRNGEIIRIHQNSSRGTGHAPLPAFLRNSPQFGTITFQPHEVIVYSHNKENGNPYGQSRLNPIYNAWFIKKHMTKYWTRNLELHGGAMFVGKTEFGSPKELDELIGELKTGSHITLKRNESLDIVFPENKESLFRSIVEWCDDQMSQGMGIPALILGQNTQFGSRSLAETHFGLFRLITVNPLQREISNIIGESYIKFLIDWNFGPQLEYPVLQFRAWTTLELEQIVNTFRKAADMQMVGTEDLTWMRERAELPELGPAGIGEPLVRIPEIPNAATSRSAEGGDTEDDLESTKRDGTNVG